MELKFKIDGDEVKAAFIGDLDTPATVEIQQDVEKLQELSSKTIKINCSKLSYIASSGLRQLIAIYKKCQADGGHLILTDINPDVMEIFSVTNFDKVFDIR